MPKSEKPSKVCSLLLSVVLVLFVAACMCIMPGPASESVGASPDPGWEDQTPVPDGEDLYAVDAVNGDVAWAVGNLGTILKTTDGGATWVEQDSGLTAPYVLLGCVSAVDTETVWVGGTNPGVLLKTTDGGENWILQEDALSAFKTPKNLSLAVSGISALDADTVLLSINYISTGVAPFGYSYDTKVWRTDDGGASWSMKLNATVPPMINEVYAVDDQVAWAAGGSDWGTPYPAVFVTSNGGSTWEYRYLDFFSNPQYKMRDVWAADALNGWALYGQVATLAGGVKRTWDGGMTWATQPSEAGVLPNALSAVDINTLWVVGTSGKIYKTIDGGATWIIQDSGVTNDLNDVCAVDIDTAWAVGDSGVILKTTDGGGGPPLIYAVQPSSAAVGATVTLNGYNFGDIRESSYVSFGGVQASAYTSWSDTQIMVEVPAGVTGTIAVTVTTNEGTSNGVEFTVQEVLPPCGTGGSTALLMLGLTLGLLSLAGSSSIRRRRRRG
jgi:photosystem II stability/assembly factor-like uncharacterized protein